MVGNILGIQDKGRLQSSMIVQREAPGFLECSIRPLLVEITPVLLFCVTSTRVNFLSKVATYAIML